MTDMDMENKPKLYIHKTFDQWKGSWKDANANIHCADQSGSVAYSVGDEIQLWDKEWHDIKAVSISENWPAINTGNGLYWPGAHAITGHKPQNA